MHSMMDWKNRVCFGLFCFLQRCVGWVSAFCNPIYCSLVGYAVRTLLIVTNLNNGTRSVPYRATGCHEAQCGLTAFPCGAWERRKNKRNKRGLTPFLTVLLAVGIFFGVFAVANQAHAALAINSATLNGGASVTVLPGASISATVSVTTSGGTDWLSTRFTAPTQCIDHPDHTTNGTFSETFNVTAPTAAGTTSPIFRASSANNTCGTGTTASLTLTNGITVTPPTVSSINRVSASPTNATSVSWTVTFDRAVTGVNTADFTLVQAGGVSGASIASVTSVSSSVYTVTANTGSGNGTLGLNLVDDDSIRDTSASTNRLGGTGSGNGNFTGQVYSIDKTAPTVPTINTVATDDVINAVEQTATVTVTGANETGATTTLNGNAVTQATATTWSYVLSAAAITAFGQGSETLTAVSTDTAGNTSTGTRNISVDTLAPTAPTINIVATNDVINAAEQTATVTVTGANETGATTTLNGNAVTQATATTWSYVLSAAAITAFGQGPETLTA
ncbi:MAG: hypothetical protein QX199_14345, partial [Methylococcaceae bacterium]